jgi:hypothetical protein
MEHIKLVKCIFTKHGKTNPFDAGESTRTGATIHTGGPMNRGSISGRSKKFVSSSKCSDKFWGPPIPWVLWAPSPVVKRNHLHPVLLLKTRAPVSTLPLQAPHSDNLTYRLQWRSLVNTGVFCDMTNNCSLLTDKQIQTQVIKPKFVPQGYWKTKYIC